MKDNLQLWKTALLNHVALKLFYPNPPVPCVCVCVCVCGIMFSVYVCLFTRAIYMNTGALRLMNTLALFTHGLDSEFMKSSVAMEIVMTSQAEHNKFRCVINQRSSWTCK